MKEYSDVVAIVNEISYLNETLQRIAICMEYRKPTEPDQELIDALEDLTEYAAQNTCLHEETYRGGTIWEICSSCGMKWADDKGGKPKDAHNLPAPIERAYEVLDMLKGR